MGTHSSVTTAFRKSPRLMSGPRKGVVDTCNPGVGKIRKMKAASDKTANRLNAARSLLDK
jgi:hypothetical protein